MATLQTGSVGPGRAASAETPRVPFKVVKHPLNAVRRDHTRLDSDAGHGVWVAVFG